MSAARILFASYALRGHMNRCLALAGELAERGHTVLFATQREGQRWLPHPAIEYVAWEPPGPAWAGDLVQHLRVVRRRAAAQRERFHGLTLIRDDAADLYPAVFTSLERILRDLEPDLLIVPDVLSPAIDLAHHRRQPAIIVASFLPRAVRRHAIERTFDLRSRGTWRRRVESAWWFLRWKRAEWRLRRARRACSACPPTDDLFRETTIIAMSDPSIEAGQTFTPNVRMVGPLIPEVLPALPASTRDWIDEHASRGIVYVAFGTLVTLAHTQLDALAEGLADCGADVLWVLPEDQHAVVRKYSRSFRLETFVPQATVLSCPGIRAFVSHAGANSAIEAMYWGRPILALPFMLDQHYYAGRVAALSVGLQLDPHAITSRDVRGAIQRLLGDRVFADAARELARHLQSTPGIRGAADLVEADLARLGVGR